MSVLVTGGSNGIGRAIVEDCLSRGETVVSLDRAPPDFTHERLHPITVDLTDAAALDAAAATVVARFAPQKLVHNAGVIRPALLADATRADLDTVVSLHLAAALALSQACLPAMRAAGHGRIVLISSRAAQGMAARTVYSATKAGLIAMARSWALELGPDGITVNAIAPGPIATDIFHEVLPVGDPRIDTLVAGIPVRRLGTPADVARAARFLLDDEAGFVTGQALFVCGGTSIGGFAL